MSSTSSCEVVPLIVPVVAVNKRCRPTSNPEFQGHNGEDLDSPYPASTDENMFQMRHSAILQSDARLLAMQQLQR